MRTVLFQSFNESIQAEAYSSYGSMSAELLQQNIHQTPDDFMVDISLGVETCSSIPPWRSGIYHLASKSPPYAIRCAEILHIPIPGETGNHVTSNSTISANDRAISWNGRTHWSGHFTGIPASWRFPDPILFNFVCLSSGASHDFKSAHPGDW